jgi:RecA-family ATPase
VTPPLTAVENADQRAARVEAARSAAPAAAWPAPLDLERLDEHEPNPPAFIIDDWLPAGYATLLAGHGGVGKSGIALHLAACIAAGLPFCGLSIQRRRVMYLSCEDRENVLEWRLKRILERLGIKASSLRGWLDIVDLVGHDCILWERNSFTGDTATSPRYELHRRIREHDTQVLFVDGVSDTFAGNENARTEVKRYVNALIALVPAQSGAVVLVGHVSKPDAQGVRNGARTTEGYSGSTAWNNSVRARWYLRHETAQSDDGESERTGDLILELQKSNLGRVDQSIRFTWDAEQRMFVGREIVPATAFDYAHRDRLEQRDILRAVEACNRKGIEVPGAQSGSPNTYEVLSAAPEFPETLRRDGRRGKSRFRRHIHLLRQSGALVREEYRKTNRHWTSRIVLSTEGVRQCVSS